MEINNNIIRKPKLYDRKRVEVYKESFFKIGEMINGGMHLQYLNFALWFFHVKICELPILHFPFAKSNTYIMLNPDEKEIIGIVNIRFFKDLEESIHKGGDIGYSIAKSQRNNGYGAKILEFAISHCKRKPILVICAKDNIASNKIVKKNGGKILKSKSQGIDKIYLIE